METLAGGCHCGNLGLAVALTASAGDYVPRVCDCDFCCKHGASYVSDPDGRLEIKVRDPQLLGRYRQGSGAAEMLVCRNCGVLVGAVYREGDTLLGVANVRALDAGSTFAAAQPASPQRLGREEKVDRWKAIWFADVTIAAP
ncbi:GFA family protein [Sphingosinicella microcystinivorans]|uniref:CENP-V/GFA domain-containing protein n=1 Tax=Sphingosinicella microcystinivorans TaxID=335406 RepID=A0AAD1FZK7_SPHMI|nr:aldehyde-activating protein [Sphingosinicella microcystinivorans]RKS89063.1 hypothetical protein DFR51_2276 [Sphingosinicella microcystinivorans]BBE32818.1 hypothetical protein SmB9_04760 [Sphingosinicella microcystinivorans]